MSASFALFVTKSPYDSRNAESAYAFCMAAIEQGHAIKHVFFYQTGIHNASSLLSVASDEVSMLNKWLNLKMIHKVPLHVCVTAATRRGVLSEQELDNKEQSNLASCFEQLGMSEYFAALHDDNIKSIQF